MARAMAMARDRAMARTTDRPMLRARVMVSSRARARAWECSGGSKNMKRGFQCRLR